MRGSTRTWLAPRPHESTQSRATPRAVGDQRRQPCPLCGRRTAVCHLQGQEAARRRVARPDSLDDHGGEFRPARQPQPLPALAAQAAAGGVARRPRPGAGVRRRDRRRAPASLPPPRGGEQACPCRCGRACRFGARHFVGHRRYRDRRGGGRVPRHHGRHHACASRWVAERVSVRRLPRARVRSGRDALQFAGYREARLLRGRGRDRR